MPYRAWPHQVDLEIKVRTNCNPGRLGAPPLRNLIMCASAAEKAFASCHAIDEPFCVSTADPRMCSHPIKNRSTCRCAPRPFHGFARGIGQSFSCSKDVHVVSAFPPVDQWVSLVVHVSHVDDGLFACSGSIAVDTLRTEQRNVDRSETYFRSSVEALPTYFRPSRSSEVSRVRKICHVVCAFSWYMIIATRN